MNNTHFGCKWLLLDYIVQNISLMNIGLFDFFYTDFVEGINVIVGPTGQGKSTILKSLAYDGEHMDLYILKKDKTEGLIQRTVFSGCVHVSKCMLLDDLGSYMSPNKFHSFLNYLSSLSVQIILTVDFRLYHIVKSFSDYFEPIKIIYLE